MLQDFSLIDRICWENTYRGKNVYELTNEFKALLEASGYELKREGYGSGFSWITSRECRNFVLMVRPVTAVNGLIDHPCGQFIVRFVTDEEADRIDRLSTRSFKFEGKTYKHLERQYDFAAVEEAISKQFPQAIPFD